MTTNLGRTLLIVNPAAQNGRGASAASFAEERLEAVLPPGTFELAFTKTAGHARKLAAEHPTLGAGDTVIALGGDGIIHEVANGIMEIPEERRPRFGVLPVGTGNDYARTLGMSLDLDKALNQLLEAEEHSLDIGLCNGEYFVETLSFGLDAAIALDTVERRVRTGRTGSRVFFESGVDVLLHRRRSFRYAIQMERKGENPLVHDVHDVHDAHDAQGARKEGLAERPVEELTPERASMTGEALILAVQLGPSYGGGFKICPGARTDDDLLDICIAHPPMGALRALGVFLLVKNALHTRLKQIEFAQAKSLIVHFGDTEEPPAAQMDGEPVEGTNFDIRSIPAALQVLVPRG